jgi:hypothetical protein
MEEEKNVPILCHTNGSYGTPGTRIKLYSNLDALKERDIYCDTDSVFYIQQYRESLRIANLGIQEPRRDRARGDYEGTEGWWKFLNNPNICQSLVTFDEMRTYKPILE